MVCHCPANHGLWVERLLLWCRLQAQEREHGRLYGHGLERLGLPRHRFLTVSLKKPAELLWTMEEALKSGSVAAVIGDAPVKVAIEAGLRMGWDQVIGDRGIFVGMNGFGASAPYKDLYAHFGITAEAVAEKAAARLG